MTRVVSFAGYLFNDERTGRRRGKHWWYWRRKGMSFRMISLSNSLYVFQSCSNWSAPRGRLERRTSISHTRVSHKDKSLNAIMNNMSDLNVISSEAVEKLNFPMEQHPNPYKVSWITYNHLERVWQCGYGCFSNNFSCQNACQWCFFIF
jgi:hypothetical protein